MDLDQSTEGSENPTSWAPPGPVSQDFFLCRDPISIMMGPVGSAKSTTGLMKGVAVSQNWSLPDENGIRHVRGAVMRKLYRDLERTTIVTWNKWFPRSIGSWTGGKGDPAEHRLLIAHPTDGTLTDLWVSFLAVGDQLLVDALRGTEFNWVFVDECDAIDPSGMKDIVSRLGRWYKDLNPWSGVWGVTNAPESDNYVVRDCIDAPDGTITFFRQPGGLSPNAENLENLPAGYYERMARLLPKHQKRRMVDNVPGLARDADVVYPEFDEDRHVAKATIPVIPGREVIIGLDAGGTPAAALLQRAPDGQIRMLAELSTHEHPGGSVTGPTRFGEMLMQLLTERVPAGSKCRLRGVADPSAAYGHDKAAGEASWIETVANVTGVPVMPAPSQAPAVREEALRRPIRDTLEAGKAGFILDPSCRLMKRALARDYRIPRIGGPHGRLADRPAKNWASHLVEATQYGALETVGVAVAMARTTRASNDSPLQANTDFNPFL